jgi:hypothetical protein
MATLHKTHHIVEGDADNQNIDCEHIDREADPESAPFSDSRCPDYTTYSG